MCIMEIHEHAANATMAQAMAHNLSTADRDADMLVKVFTARHDYAGVRAVQSAQAKVHAAYAEMLELFGEYAAQASMDSAGHVHHGSERTIESVVKSATDRAHSEETR